jgi:hypothetical protein
MRLKAIMFFMFQSIYLFAQTSSLDENRKYVVVEYVYNYISILEEKEILAETAYGLCDPVWIVEDINFMRLPPGITILLPIISEAKDLVDIIGEDYYHLVLGGIEWIVSIDYNKNIIIFEDSGK